MNGATAGAAFDVPGKCGLEVEVDVDVAVEDGKAPLDAGDPDRVADCTAAFEALAFLDRLDGECATLAAGESLGDDGLQGGQRRGRMGDGGARTSSGGTMC